MSQIYNDVLETIGNTPIVKLHRMGRDLGATILVKLESRNPGASIKDRIAWAMIEEAEKEGFLTPDSHIVEPTSGNTGIGLAIVCAVKGYKLTLTMPENMSLERRKILQAFGANIVLTPREDGMNGAITRAEQIADEDRAVFIPQQFKNVANPEIHRQTTAREIMDATKGHLDAFVCGVGTGGTITGIGEILRQEIGNSVEIVAVEPAESPVLSGGLPAPHKIQGIGVGFLPEVLNTDIYNRVVQVNYEDAKQATQDLARLEGIFAGISSGAAVWAALEVAKELGEGKVLLAILPDTGERYLSTDLWEYPDLQNILDAAPFLIFYKDTENRFVKVNKAFEDMTGLSREQIIGKTSFDLFPSDADMYWQDDLQIINSGRRMLHLLEPMHVGGEIRWIQTNKIPYVDEQGKIIGIIGFSEDITEHRQMEQKLQENEEKYRLLFESSTDAITVNGVLNNQEPGCFLEVNKVACQLFGYTKEEMLQLTPLDLLDPEMISVIPSFREKLFRDNHLLHETVYVAKDRTKIPVELHTRLFELKGQPAVLSIIRNITKRKEGEALIQQYVAKVERSNRELEQYATIISHDLKTPLVSILGFSELLDKKYKDLLNPEALDFVQSIIRSGKRMQEMINSLLTLARLKVREEDLELVDCEDIISQVLEDMQFPISEAGANITHDTLPVVKGVKTLLSQVFANLIGNAIKFHGSEPPAVHIAVVNLDTEWQFSVQDNGIGFDPQLAGALFTIFRRFHTQAEYPGTGVGLSICKKIVEQHGGSIWAESQVGEGATFFFTLPKSVI